MVLVSHLASYQYVLLLFNDGESVCQGKQCYSAGQGHTQALREAIECCFNSSLYIHSVNMQPSSDLDLSRYSPIADEKSGENRKIVILLSFWLLS